MQWYCLASVVWLFGVCKPIQKIALIVPLRPEIWPLKILQCRH